MIRCADAPLTNTFAKQLPLMAKVTNKKVNVAIIGLGFGAEFIPIYQKHPHAKMYAICQRNEEQLNKIGDAFGIAQRYTEYDDVLTDPNVDFVHINSPIPDHACDVDRGPQGRQARHVYRADGDDDRGVRARSVELVEETGLKYMMAETVVY